MTAGADRFDLVVVGSGPAGEKAATHAAYFGRRVAVVERSPSLGGAPVGAGGVPTKTLRETALYLTGFRRSNVYGVGLDLDPARMAELARRRNDEVRATMVDRVRQNLARHHVEIVHGTARLTPEGTVAVELAGGAERTLRAASVLLATGSVPFHPPGFAFDDPDVLDSDAVVDSLEPVEEMVVVGTGPIGCEYASIFAALGTRVTLIGDTDRILPIVDAEISAQLREAFVAMGISVRVGTAVTGITRGAGGLEVRLAGGDTLATPKALVVAGRAGTTSGLGLEHAGVRLDPRGRIIVDDTFETSAPGIYAAGDVIGPPGLASVSMEQGRLAASHACRTEYWHAQASAPAMGVYSLPEIGMAGLTEEQARERGIDFAVGRASFAANTRATIAGDPTGMAKLVFARADRRLLGIHVIGEAAAELVHIGQAVLQHRGTIDYFVHSTFNVPTLSEILKYAAFDGLARVGL